MIFKLSYLNSNLALTLGYLNPALNNSAQVPATQAILCLNLQRSQYYVFSFVFGFDFLPFCVTQFSACMEASGGRISSVKAHRKS